MRPTLSELGEYDGTALMEFKTHKEIVYLLERGSVCTYEMDDTPPFEIDQEAVRIAIEMAELCNLNLVSELHVMRKQYLDGSIPTGFQRTAMVGLTGAIPFRVPALSVDRELRIRQLSLEEDSCRELSDVGHRITFRTDRLGMPLTEMVTEPELLTPQELQAGAMLLADLARATRKVRRGPGAARQDVNVSIAGGRRVEIKGVPHHKKLPLLVHTEAFRQLNLLRVRAELENRGVTADALPVPPPTGRPWQESSLILDVSSLLRRSGYQPLRTALDGGEVGVAVRLPGFQGLLPHPTQPGLTFAHEISERIRVIACPGRTPFMTHAESRGESLADGLWREVKAALNADSGDGVVVVWAPEEDAATAAREVLLRARDALDGIPSETRQAHFDGTTGFERVLPGPDRMYPDTDTPPLPIPDATIQEVGAQIAETPWARQARYQAMGLDSRAAQALSVAPWADLFDQVSPKTGEPASRLAAVLEKRIPYHTRILHGSRPRREEELPDTTGVDSLVRALEDGRIRPEALVRAFDDLMTGEEVQPAEVLARYRIPRSGSEALTPLVEGVVRRSATLGSKPVETLVRWGMGEIMRDHLGRVAPREVRQRLEAAFGAQPRPLGGGDGV
jgi:glutamyl-tRNA(Gln) amidotransferase subunit E